MVGDAEETCGLLTIWREHRLGAIRAARARRGVNMANINSMDKNSDKEQRPMSRHNKEVASSMAAELAQQLYILIPTRMAKDGSCILPSYCPTSAAAGGTRDP